MRGPIVLARDERLDPAYDRPVALAGGADGYIEVQPVEPSMQGIRMQFRVPTVSGMIDMVDYASVDTWDTGTHVCTWLPIETRHTR